MLIFYFVFIFCFHFVHTLYFGVELLFLVAFDGEELLFEEVDHLTGREVLDADGEVDNRVVVEVDDVAVVGLLERLEVDRLAVACLGHAERQLVLVLDFELYFDLGRLQVLELLVYLGLGALDEAAQVAVLAKRRRRREQRRLLVLLLLLWLVL